MAKKSKARILLVDDSAELLSAAARLLEECGYEVITTTSGADALCLLAADPPPDLLILDMILPGVDGRTVLKALKPTAPPVVLMSGVEVGPAAEHPAVKRVLPKQFDDVELMAVVEDVLGEPPCYPQALLDTKEDCPPPVEMTDEERVRAERRFHKANGGAAHAG